MASTPSFGTEINTMIRMFELLRRIDSEMPSQMAHCFLCVALMPGLTMQELSERTGLAQSSTSRNIQTLGKWHRIGKPGYDLVTAVDDPVDQRRKIMFLTPKGTALMSDLLTILRGEPTEFVPTATAPKSFRPVPKGRYAAT